MIKSLTSIYCYIWFSDSSLFDDEIFLYETISTVWDHKSQSYAKQVNIFSNKKFIKSFDIQHNFKNNFTSVDLFEHINMLKIMMLKECGGDWKIKRIKVRFVPFTHTKLYTHDPFLINIL